MIESKDLIPDDIGRWVVADNGMGDQEVGRIKSYTPRVIFVVYKCDGQWHRFQDFAGVSTEGEDLFWLEGMLKIEHGRMMPPMIMNSRRVLKPPY